MRYGYLIAVVLGVIAVAAAFGWWRVGLRLHARERRGWVANTGYVRDLPRYRALMRRTRMAVAGLLAVFCAAAVSLSVVAANPVDRRVDDRRLASRDIVLCLDASGSMLEYDSEIGDAFKSLVEHFNGERVSLYLWSARSVRKFPLTDDYTMVNENLETLSSLLRNGVISKTSNGYRITNDLARYLEGTEDPDEQAASLIGDGLASCVLGFDHTDQERSRTIILASDNEVNGEGLYSLKEAIDFAKRQKVEVIGLYPGSALTTEGEDMKNQIESTGGEFYTMSSSGTVDSIIQNIEAQQKREVEGDARVTVTDRVNTPVAWLAVAIVAFLGLIGFAKL